MVLTLKRWKSRSSPGIAAGAAGKNPFTCSNHKAAAGSVRAAAFVSCGTKTSHTAQAGWSSPPTGSPTRSRDKQLPGCHAQPTMVTRGEAARQQDRDQRSCPPQTASGLPCAAHHGDAGWSSPVARQAHNLKVAGSNPAPATITTHPHRHTLASLADTTAGAVAQWAASRSRRVGKPSRSVRDPGPGGSPRAHSGS